MGLGGVGRLGLGGISWESGNYIANMDNSKKTKPPFLKVQISQVTRGNAAWGGGKRSSSDLPFCHLITRARITNRAWAKGLANSTEQKTCHVKERDG